MEQPTIYSFSSFTRTLAEKAFQLQPLIEKPLLMKTWEQKAQEQIISELEETILTFLHKDLKMSVGGWNEQELQAQFIHPFLRILQFTNYQLRIGAFSERPLKTTIKNAIIQGKVDWMVASGRYDPEQPFFFIHEYKRGVGGNGDPVGQLLATMYVTKLLNQTPKKPTLFDPNPIAYQDVPIYGCYVIGQYWNFVVLKDKDYYISKSYDVTDEEKLYEIVKLLKAQKQMIIDRVTQNQ